MFVSLNYLAILVAGLVTMVLGAIWYSPPVFGKLWMSLSKLTKKDMEEAKKKGMAPLYVVQLISALVTSYVLAHFIDYLGAITWLDGVVAGFWLWLGFVATVTIGSVLWEGKSFKLYILNNAYNLLSLIIMGAILALWA